MWKTHLTAQPLSDELLAEIEEACQRYRDEHRRYADESDEEPDAPPPADATAVDSLPATRLRKPTDRYDPASYMYVDTKVETDAEVDDQEYV